MKNNDMHFSLDELCALVELPKRRIRFYMQRGLVDKACGTSRGSYYTQEHLNQLLTIRKWQEAGLSLERIAELIRGDDLHDVPVPKSKAGSIKVWSHIHLAPGVELHIEPGMSGLTPEQVREMSMAMTSLLDAIKSGDTK